MSPIVRVLNKSAKMVTMLTELDGIMIPPLDGFDYRIYIVDGTKNSVIMLFVNDEFDRYI